MEGGESTRIEGGESTRGAQRTGGEQKRADEKRDAPSTR